MTAGDLRRFIRELPEDTRIDFQFGEQALELLALGRHLGYAELHFAGSAHAAPAGETPANATY